MTVYLPMDIKTIKAKNLTNHCYFELIKTTSTAPFLEEPTLTLNGTFDGNYLLMEGIIKPRSYRIIEYEAHFCCFVN